jgi:hypothetical protein
VKVTTLPDGTRTPGAASLSVPLVSLTREMAGVAPKWLSGLVAVTGPPAPGGGVPGGRAQLEYWAGRGDARRREGPGLGRVEQAVAVGVAADERGGEVVGRGARRPGVVGDHHADSGTLPGLVTT